MNKKIICAAVRQDDIIICSARHFDKLMSSTISNLDIKLKLSKKWEQGFVDQFGTFYDREEAYILVRQNDQDFSPKRNSSTKELYSEGLY